jgi:hypothetical protein
MRAKLYCKSNINQIFVLDDVEDVLHNHLSGIEVLHDCRPSFYIHALNFLQVFFLLFQEDVCYTPSKSGSIVLLAIHYNGYAPPTYLGRKKWLDYFQIEP